MRFLLLTALFLGLMSAAADAQQFSGPVELQQVPNCQDSSGQHLNYNSSTGALSCGTTSSTTTLDDTAVWSVPSTVTVVAGTTIVIPAYPFTSGTITSIHYATNGGSPSFTASVEIGGTVVTGCSSISVSSSTDTSATCTGANTLTSGNQVTVVISSVSGTPDEAYVQINFSRSVN